MAKVYHAESLFMARRLFHKRMKAIVRTVHGAWAKGYIAQAEEMINSLKQEERDAFNDYSRRLE